jgi:ABC-2 type transport system ATP-binding protein
MSDHVILRTVNLTKIYRKRRKSVLALDQLTLALEPGEVFGFLGPNGAGKSTMIKIITGQIQPSGGLAEIFGGDVSNISGRKRLGYLPENPSFYGFLTGREYLKFVARCFSDAFGKKIAEVNNVLEKLDLVSASDRPIRTYSKGMVQRLGLAQALVHDPDLYILDEPMSGLDPLGRALVKDIIKDLKNRGKTIFFSTHITSDVEAVCDRLGVIVGGRLRAIERVDKIIESQVTGYQIQVKDTTGILSKITVSEQCLQETMGRILLEGLCIERIEPERKTFESFFLDVVDRVINEN